MHRATYTLTVEGPADFDFDLDDLGDAIAAHLDGEPEQVDAVTVHRTAAARVVKALRDRTQDGSWQGVSYHEEIDA